MTTIQDDPIKIVDYTKCPKKPDFMAQERYEDLCHIFAECNYNLKKFEARVDALNKSSSIIHVCNNCGKVDIDPIRHYRECDPAYEQYRREQQDVYWK